jgi:hypothetical protein
VCASETPPPPLVLLLLTLLRRRKLLEKSAHGPSCNAIIAIRYLDPGPMWRTGPSKNPSRRARTNGPSSRARTVSLNNSGDNNVFIFFISIGGNVLGEKKIKKKKKYRFTGAWCGEEEKGFAENVFRPFVNEFRR